MLEIRDLRVAYGAIEALHGISLEVGEGEIVALIGSNGAGKSTLLNTISGLIRPTDGTILYQGKPLERTPPYEIVSMGVCQVPEGRRIFASMTVLENLELGAYLAQNRVNFQENLARTYALFPRLKEREKQEAGTLSGGEQQMLAIGRALMGNPKLLLLDEPSLGLAPRLVEEVYEVIVEIQRMGTPILVVEQNAFQALSVADRGYVIETGNIVMHDAADRLLENPQVKEAYLGE
ncbi:MAG TPA: ABC transporter ATP-binding protein [Chloroflexi bacterium]|nr:ABC transporter ATP-binding protein [Chloroflexota bacterium]